MFKPVNRYIQVEMEAAEAGGPSGIVLPEDYAPVKERYATARVVSWAADVRFDDSLIIDTKIVIDQSMIEEIQINNKKIIVILDNYVVGIV
jgi:co-chaperonin GroES (HSP10)